MICVCLQVTSLRQEVEQGNSMWEARVGGIKAALQVRPCVYAVPGLEHAAWKGSVLLPSYKGLETKIEQSVASCRSGASQCLREGQGTRLSNLASLVNFETGLLLHLMSESHNFLAGNSGLAQGMCSGKMRNSPFLLHPFLNQQRRQIRITAGYSWGIRS